MSKAFPWYTARGDDGTTGLLGAGRVPKHHPQPEAFGAVDEAGSMIGFARALIDDREINDLLVQVQRHCYGLMAELAATPDAQAKFRQIGSEQVAWLANLTDQDDGFSAAPLPDHRTEDAQGTTLGAVGAMGSFAKNLSGIRA